MVIEMQRVFLKVLTSITFLLFLMYLVFSLILTITILDSQGYSSGHFEGFGIEFFLFAGIILTVSLFTCNRSLKKTKLRDQKKLIFLSLMLIIISLLPIYLVSPPRLKLLTTGLLVGVAFFRIIVASVREE